MLECHLKCTLLQKHACYMLLDQNAFQVYDPVAYLIRNFFKIINSPRPYGPFQDHMVLDHKMRQKSKKKKKKKKASYTREVRWIERRRLSVANHFHCHQQPANKLVLWVPKHGSFMFTPKTPGALNLGPDGDARKQTLNKGSFGERFSPKKGVIQ